MIRWKKNMVRIFYLKFFFLKKLDKFYFAVEKEVLELENIYKHLKTIPEYGNLEVSIIKTPLMFNVNRAIMCSDLVH